LTVNAAGATTFGGTIGGTTPLSSLSTDAGGTTLLPAAVTTSGAQNYGDSATLSSNTALNASGVSFGDLVGGAFDLTLRTDAWSITNTASGSGAIDVAPTTAAGSIGLAGGIGTLQLGSPLFAKLTSFNSLTVGRADGTGAISAGALTLPSNTTITSSTGP